MDSKEIIKKVEENISKPMVTAKFGDNWREHAMKMYDIDNIFDIAWRQGRKSILLERELDKICNLLGVGAKTFKMKDTKRTPKETAKVVAKTISDIRRVLDAVPVMTGYSFFDAKLFKTTGFDSLVKKVCGENDISEKHIRTVGGWLNDE